MPVSRDVAISRGHVVADARDLGRLLRARRRQLGYTQEYVAVMMHCSPRLVGEMEHGRGTVGFNKMLLYAMNLGIDLVAFER